MNRFNPQEFIQDFLEESNEHLHRVRENLLVLEETFAASPVDAAVARVTILGNLFRSFHTLKSLAGMVGLGAAEQLSHRMESVLGGMQRMDIEITTSAVDSLLHAVSTLDTVIDGLRNPSQTVPGVEADLAALDDLLAHSGDSSSAASPSSSPFLDKTASTDSEQDAAASLQDVNDIPVDLPFLRPIVEHAPDFIASLSPVERLAVKRDWERGLIPALAIFTPSPDRAAHGENVNVVRKQLTSAGNLIKGLPLIQGSAIRFAFLVALPQPVNEDQFLPMEWILADSQAVGLQGKALTSSHTAQSVAPAPVGAPTSVRVDLSRMDDLLRLVGDLVVTRARIAELLPELEGAPVKVVDTLQELSGRMERSLREMRSAVLRARMVPLSEVFNHFPLAVRDLNRATGKEVRLTIKGETTQVDKQLVERLLEPLLHLVRNAITHGIETPGQRQSLGKPAEGQISLTGSQEGEHILITVSDDGRGLDLEKVAARAVKLGLLEPGVAITESEALDLICRPGFSTRDRADLAAGRGVGLDVVAQFLQAVGGRLSLSTRLGQGSAFTMRLPLTLTIVDAFIVAAGPERFAVPRSAVDVIVEINPSEVINIEGGQIMHYRGGPLTLLRLSRLFNLPGEAVPGSNGRQTAAAGYGLVLNDGEKRKALVVDRLFGLRELVVRTITDPLIAGPGIGGATELGDGSVILILDVQSLLRMRPG